MVFHAYNSYTHSCILTFLKTITLLPFIKDYKTYYWWGQKDSMMGREMLVCDLFRFNSKHHI